MGVFACLQTQYHCKLIKMSSEVLSSLRGKVLEIPQRKTSNGSEKSGNIPQESEKWTPYNGDMHMQGIKVIVNNPTEKKAKVDCFEETMLLIEIYRHKLELAKYEKKEKKIRELAMEQKKREMRPIADTLLLIKYNN